MKTRNLLEVPAPWPKVRHSFNAKLIEVRLQELAKKGVYYDDRILL